MKKKCDAKLVLFVCTGNSCRSVMAENLFKKLLTDEGFSEKIKAVSAGTAVRIKIKPRRGTIKVLSEEGVSVEDGYRAKRVTPDILNRADLVIVMEKRHRHNLLEKKPGLEDKIFLINQFLPQRNLLDLPDPIGRPLYIYQETKEKIKEALPGILKKAKGLL